MSTPCVSAFGASIASGPLGPLTIPRRDPGPSDVALEILFCGICHSDIHTARDEWGKATYPCVPGHEIVGNVTDVGADVTKFAVGDKAAVGVMVDSCKSCTPCQKGLEQYCKPGVTFTYNSKDKRSGGVTYGGYSSLIVVDEAFVLRVPDGLDLAAMTPLLCAGITTYSPLRLWKAGPGKRVGVVGLGGLGHMAVKFARAMGAHVVLFTTSPSKVSDGLRLGAHEVVLSTDADAMDKMKSSLDIIINCVSAQHDVNAFLGLLDLDGTMVLVGLPPEKFPVKAGSLVLPRRNLSGSCIGGIPETQEMLDFCAEHGIVSDIELISAKDVNRAWDRVVQQDVKYRFVIDIGTLKEWTNP